MKDQEIISTERPNDSTAAKPSTEINPVKRVVEITAWKEHAGLVLSLIILFMQAALKYGFSYEFNPTAELLVNLFAYFLAGWNVIRLAFIKLKRGDIFNEFVLMTVATLGAFYIGEYAEGVAVMAFYSIGEWFQDSAVKRAKSSIKALLDIRPDHVTLINERETKVVKPSSVGIGETILVRPGERVALDGELLSHSGFFNTAALTGESTPHTKRNGDQVLAGMINLNTVVEVKVSALFRDSKLSRILELVQEATARKSQTQLFISRFAKVYTPIVFFMAAGVVLLPFFFDEHYIFNEWLYRGLVFLVISCPCALVVSIPLGYFGGIGLASRNGVLFKGGNFLDAVTKVDTVFMDKTGTLTKGVFKVRKIVAHGVSEDFLLDMVIAVEENSLHPIARAIVEHGEGRSRRMIATDVREIAGMGLEAAVNNQPVVVGNSKLMRRLYIHYPIEIDKIADTVVIVAINNRYGGYITIADEVKSDAAETVNALHKMKIRTVMLSGDKQQVVTALADVLHIDEAYGDLMPEDKLKWVQTFKENNQCVAFVGDGINDAPVIALADVGIAMGGLGSDAAIETADVVIQDDHPMNIITAIRAGRITRNIVWQNIIMALLVKILILLLGAWGMANLWQAVIADVGVALLAILNAIRIQSKNLRTKPIH